MEHRGEYVRSEGTMKEKQDRIDVFLDILDQLREVNEQLAEQLEKKLEAAIEDGDMTYEQATRKVTEVIAKRRKIETGGNVVSELSENTIEVSTEGRATLALVLESLRNEENLLGEGGVAKVCHITGTSGVCAKVAKVDSAAVALYKEGNSIHQERDFLDNVRDLNVSGVRAPRAYASFSVEQDIIMLMEELPAVSLQDVLDRIADIPSAFDLNTFFDNVRAYLEELHRRGIYHMDVAPRNLMIDVGTGNAYVIDFGKSHSKLEMMGEDFDRFATQYEQSDLASLRITKTQIEEFLLKRKK